MTENTPVPRDAQPHNAWEFLIGWFINNQIIVFLFLTLLVGAGIYVMPFSFESSPVVRAPLPVDAIPDMGENQQIVFTEWQGRSPRDIEDQITYPLTTALLGLPGVRTIRSSSAFGFSTIYIIFNDDVEFYWSRSRVLEKLAALPPGTVPDGVMPTLGPDANALGQIFWYTLEGQDPHGQTVGGWDPDELRSIQDWTVRYALQSVEGVSEVASIGGFVREYQVDIDPEALRAHGVSLAQVTDAVRKSNLDVGARTLEVNSVEYVVRGLGKIKDLKDLEATVVVARAYTPIRIRDVGRVSLGPALRRGALDDEGATAVGGVVVSRYNENPLTVISAIKEKITQIQAGLPQRTLENGTSSQVTIVPFYDRTSLIKETLKTVTTALYQEILITVIVVLIMLRDLRSSMMISFMLPLGVLATFVGMKALGANANIMALGGIAIAIGTMVDIGTIFVENIHRHLSEALPDAPRVPLIRRAAAEVAPALMTSVLTTVISFLPVFGLSSTELKLFSPLALTKTLAMIGTYLLALTVLPGAAILIFRKQTAAPTTSYTGIQRLTHALCHRERFWDWLILGCGLNLVRFSLTGGLLTIFLGVYRLARPKVLSLASPSTVTLTENLLIVASVTLLLTQDWLPLGWENGLLVNMLFVGGLLTSILGAFRSLEWIYPRLLRLILRHKRLFFILPGGVVGFGITAWLGFDTTGAFLPQSIRNTFPLSHLSRIFPGLGREYMPNFDEGAYLYMPTTMPHASIREVLHMMSKMDSAIAQIPEVDRVVGKLGRVNSALDPAPLSMIETMVTYKPEYKIRKNGEPIRQWRKHIRSPRDIWNEIVRAAKRPGLTSAPTLMPINARLVMLQSGMRAPMGIKVHGPNLKTIEAFGLELEKILKQVPAIRPETVFADRVVGKPYLEINLDREAIGRYGLTVVDVQNVLQVALGGIALTRTVEGRERYPVRVRYMREERDSFEAIERVSVPTATGDHILLSQLAHFRYIRGPQVIKAEDTFLTSYVLFDHKSHIAEVETVEQARRIINNKISRDELKVPAGISFTFAGTYENQVRSEKRLMVLIPIALILVFILLHLQFHRTATSAIIYTGVLVGVSGGFILLWLYCQPWFLNINLFGMSMRDLFQVGNINISVAVWIGFIVLIGITTDDGVVMSIYLRQCFERDPPTSIEAVRQRTLEAGSRRLRPCLMTTATTILALLPVVTSQGRGSDIMMPMALPSLGGMAIELLTLFVVPVLYCALEEKKLRKQTVPPSAMV
ncbi:MAG: efflux RND transporter permease subunit [Myxococcales bacterium]|nr:efflux RND transporter permease subunit [Myxococcales bacterium]